MDIGALEASAGGAWAAGLDRLSPWATTVCVLAANSPDSDIIVGVTTDRWNYLHHHRGITHSIVGTIAIGLLVPLLVAVTERTIASIRRRAPTIRLRGLMAASLIAAATHPLMDWMNNNGLAAEVIKWIDKLPPGLTSSGAVATAVAEAFSQSRNWSPSRRTRRTTAASRSATATFIWARSTASWPRST